MQVINLRQCERVITTWTLASQHIPVVTVEKIEIEMRHEQEAKSKPN